MLTAERLQLIDPATRFDDALLSPLTATWSAFDHLHMQA
jgi:hypothetical protein